MAEVKFTATANLVPKVDWARFINQPNEGYIMVMGPSGEGKTFSALSVSEDFDEKRLSMPIAELATVDERALGDIVHLAWDFGALDGIRGYGMMPVSLDMQEFVASLGEHGPVEFPRKGLRDFLEAGYQPGMTHCIDDTVSSLDDIMATYWTHHKPLTKGDNDNSAAMWVELAATHSAYRTEVNAFIKRHKLQRIVLAHTMAKQVSGYMATKFSALKAEAEGREGDLIVPALTGKSGQVYINHASMVLFLDKVGAVGSQSRERKLLCGAACPRVQTKNRMVHITGETMPGLLGQILRQVKSHRASTK